MNGVHNSFAHEGAYERRRAAACGRWASGVLASSVLVCGLAAGVRTQLASAATTVKTINLVEVDRVITVVGARDVQHAKVGDTVVTTGTVYRRVGVSRRGARLGAVETVCTVVAPRRGSSAPLSTCVAAFHLKGGELVATGEYPLGSTHSIPVLGGTGIYTGARGVLKIQTITPGQR
jgi:hypothetical protein